MQVLDKATERVVQKPDRFNNNFSVQHYAGEVSYDVDGFLEKNTDRLHADISNLFKKSRQQIIHKLFTDPAFTNALDASSAGGSGSGSTPVRGRREVPRRGGLNGAPNQKQKTVGWAFREQLDKLVDILSSTFPRYVRCIKPNSNKAPVEFDSPDVLRQLRSAG